MLTRASKTRVGDRLAHVDLRRVVVHDVGAEIGDGRVDGRRVREVALVELRLRVHELAEARRQVVEHGHVVAERDEAVRHVRTDEAGTARHQDAHVRPPLASSPRARAHRPVAREPAR